MQIDIQENSIVLPGEKIAILNDACDVMLGTGVTFNETEHGAEIIATIGGLVCMESSVLQGASSIKIGVENGNPYSCPRVGDLVIGYIQRECGGFYHVDINYSLFPAILDIVSFDGATRYNRPRLQRGDLIFAHVIHAGRGNEPEISCCATSEVERRDWVTGGGSFGQLKDGLVINLPSYFARMILEKRVPLLDRIGELTSYDLAVGLNGRVWVKASTAKICLGIAYLLEGCVSKGLEQMEREVSSVFTNDADSSV